MPEVITRSRSSWEHNRGAVNVCKVIHVKSMQSYILPTYPSYPKNFVTVRSNARTAAQTSKFG